MVVTAYKMTLRRWTIFYKALKFGLPRTYYQIRLF